MAFAATRAKMATRGYGDDSSAQSRGLMRAFQAANLVAPLRFRPPRVRMRTTNGRSGPSLRIDVFAGQGAFFASER